MKKMAMVLLVLTGCMHQPPDLRDRSMQEAIDADLAMSKMALTEGFHKSLLAYAGDSVIKPGEGEWPVIGFPELEKSFSNKTVIKTLEWKPVSAEASVSGDMAFTFGNWRYTKGDTAYYGNYYTVWKKQKDGQWKFIFDAGNNTPANPAFWDADSHEASLK